MRASSSQLIDKLWRLKRSVDKGECQGLSFVHLNHLLRDPRYRADVLAQVRKGGTTTLRELAEAIGELDTGESLMAPREQRAIIDQAPARERHDSRPGWLRRQGIWVLPVAITTIAAMAGFTAFENRQIHVRDDITSATTWESDRTYVLEDTIFVRNTSLTIEPGATIKGIDGSALIVTRDSQLFSRGRPDQPIVFTSHRQEGERARGDWGGVVLLGNAPVNEPAATIEGLSQSSADGVFGGDSPADSCGVVEYTRIEFAGFEVYKGNELNGLTLGGCGSGTIIRKVQIHRALDDGIEMFGGTVDLKHILITGAGDDSIDWDWGWTGRVQFAVIQQYPDAGDNAFEGDNNGNDHNALPRSEPVFYNVTLAASGVNAREHRGMVLREGTGGHFHNMIIDSYGLGAIDTRDEVTSRIGDGTLTFSHNLIANSGHLGGAQEESGDRDDDYGFDEYDWIRTPRFDNQFRIDTALQAVASSQRSPGFETTIRTRQMTATKPPQSEFFDESAIFQGALNPVTRDSWITGWTAFPEN